MDTPRKGTTRDMIALAGIGAIALLLTVPEIEWTVSLYADTAARLWIAQGPWHTIVPNVVNFEFHPPLWHFYAKIVTFLSPVSDVVTLRAINYLLYLALIPTGYAVGRLVQDRGTGLAVAALMPWNGYLLEIALRLDHYFAYGLLSVVLLALLLKMIDGRSPYVPVLYAAVAVLLGFVHYTGFLFVASTGVFVVLYLAYEHGPVDVFRATLADVRRPRLDLNVDLDSPSFYSFFLLHLPVLLVYLAWAPFFLKQYEIYSAAAYTSGGLSLSSLWFRVSFIGFNLFPSGVLPRVPLAIAAGVVGAVAVVAMVRERRRRLILGPVAVAMFVALFVGGVNGPRHVFFAAGLVPVVVGITVTDIGRAAYDAFETGDRTRALSFGSITIILACILLVTYGASALTMPTPEPRSGDLNAVVDFVEGHVTEDAVILVCTPPSEMILHVYGVGESTPKYGIPVEAIGDGHRFNPDWQPGTGNIYHPNESAHRTRLREAVGEHRTIVLFIGHGYVRDRCTRIAPDVRSLDYHAFDSIRRNRFGAIAFRANTSR